MCCVKVAGGSKKRTQIGWLDQRKRKCRGVEESRYRGEVSAENRATSRGRKRGEKGEREREVRETERQNGRTLKGVGRFVPAWLPSLGWWAIAAMRAPIATEWRGRDWVPAMHRLCTLTMHRLCTITRS